MIRVQVFRPIHSVNFKTPNFVSCRARLHYRNGEANFEIELRMMDPLLRKKLCEHIMQPRFEDVLVKHSSLDSNLTFSVLWTYFVLCLYVCAVYK